MKKYITFFILLLTSTITIFAQPTGTKQFPSNLPKNETNGNADDLVAQAIAHYDGGRYEKALNLVNQAMKVNQEGRLSDILFYYRALCNIQLKENQEALADLDTAILFNDTKAHYYYHRANLRIKNNAIDLAYADYEKCLTLENRYEAAWVKKGVILQQRNQNRAALIAYNKAIGLNDKNAEAYYHRAMIMLQVGMPVKGCEDLEKSSNLGYRFAEKAKQKYCSQ